VALGQKKQYSSRLRFKAEPTLRNLQPLSFFTRMLPYALVISGPDRPIFSINRPEEVLVISGQPGKVAGTLDTFHLAVECANTTLYLGGSPKNVEARAEDAK
jgi:hypothetical protein